MKQNSNIKAYVMMDSACLLPCHKKLLLGQNVNFHLRALFRPGYRVVIIDQKSELQDIKEVYYISCTPDYHAAGLHTVDY